MMSVVTETHAEAGQRRALLLVITVAYKPMGECENFLLGGDGAHIQFSKTSQLAPIFLHSASMP